jgi:hypothetical protein
MRFISLFVASSLAAIVLAPTERVARSATSVVEGASRDAEVSRVRGHFDSVLVELAASDISALTSEQRTRRASLVTTLRTYRDRGAFPRNYDFPGRAVPYFVDRKTGVLCAVAHLLESTGRRDIVDRVAAADNNVWVPQLAGDTAFTEWLNASGLTLTEAARIQVPYDNNAPSLFMLASVATSTLAAGTTLWNATGNRNAKHPFVSVLGILAGATAVTVAIGGASQDGVPAGFNVMNFGFGATSALVATGSLMRRQHLSAQRRAAERRVESERKSGVDATVAPAFSVAGQKGPGILVQVRF